MPPCIVSAHSPYISVYVLNLFLASQLYFSDFLKRICRNFILCIADEMLPRWRNNVICLANVHDVPSFRRVFPLLDILGMHDVNDRILLKILSGMLFHHRISRNGLLQLALDNGM